MNWENLNAAILSAEVLFVASTMDYSQFDVFLCHNSEEKSQVEQIRDQLRAKQIYAFLDRYDFEPFRPWQKQLEEVMPRIKAAAIFLGQSGMGPWQDIEMQGFLQEFARRELRMGIVVLPNCPDELIEKVPLFLKSFHHIDFRQTRPHPMGQLIWGITGNRLDFEEGSSLEEVNISRLTPLTQLEAQNSSDLDKLESLLSAQKWKEADEQTKKIVLKDNQGNRLTAPKIRELASELLDSIDRLWVGYSGGKFGLKIQRQLWQKILEPKKKPRFNPFAKVEAPVTESQAWSQFVSSVGWYSDDKRQYVPDERFDFSRKAPEGCFPRTRLWLHGGHGNSVKQFVILMDQVKRLE
ncbi:GUN4 domain-containing protein [Leptolyngbya sp. FACHB-17]|uniref:GUN4 domain-containing protein n=1 Tax=unclassified Leptolyngbya TaxID=2650499 RepID=UPI001680A6F3|nr:GUN4 domain-containing protein [Leptolyngbya sp. FACHB-17]MBD2079543.1 GUN4 domain-containing protein [Leptolyngbya sp. FACHB-17]